jgi:hypothetical protein
MGRPSLAADPAFFFGAFAVPALLYAFYGYERASSSHRYTVLLMIPYAVAVGVGLAAISDQIEAVATRVWPGSRRIGTLATALMAIMVGLLSVKSLSDIYASNPKQRPNDLREGFDYVRSRIQPNDLLLEASTSKEGPVFWFKSFNSYYLRGFSPPPAVTTIETTNFPKGFTYYLDRTGRLWVLITVADDEVAAVQDRAGSDFDVQCFRRICAIHWHGGERPMLEQVVAFFDKFADLDPNPSARTEQSSTRRRSSFAMSRKRKSSRRRVLDRFSWCRRLKTGKRPSAFAMA